MEVLLVVDFEINVVYIINEFVVVGVYEVLKLIGCENDVLIVLVDGGCFGVQNVVDGVIGVILQQYLLLMVLFGIEVIVFYVVDGILFVLIEGKDFFDIGVVFVIDMVVDGVDLILVVEGMDFCWG